MKQKSFAYVILIILLSGFLTFFKNLSSIEDLLIEVIYLIILLYTIGIVLSNRLLFIKDGKIYLGLIFKDIILYKKEIDLNAFNSIIVYKNNYQENIPSWTGPIIDIFFRDHLYKLKLTSLTSKKEKPLISLRDESNYEKAIDFFERNSNLKIELAE